MKADRPALSPARLLAWSVLGAVEGKGARIEVALNRCLAGEPLSGRDRALATEIVYGVCRWQGFLDYILERCSDRPASKIEPEVQSLLRLGAYQILKLDKVPHRATVHTSVDLAKARLNPGAAGFVNAVLRRVCELAADPPLPEEANDPIGRLAVAQSHPRWLVERWCDELGREECAALLEANNTPGVLTLRTLLSAGGRQRLSDRLARAGVEARPGRYSPQALAAAGANVARLEEIAPASAVAQSEAAQLISLVLAPQPGWRVLDLCAGVGGKATHLAELMGDEGQVIGLDKDPLRLEAGRRLARRLGMASISFFRADALGDWPQEAGSPLFEAVLVDAPCTGLGVLRSRPERRWRVKPTDPARLGRFQARLLAAGAGHVRPGGVLIYATCTLTVEENQGVAAGFLAANPDFEAQDATAYLPPSARSLVEPGGFLQTWPHRHGLDGFFAARFKRRS
ncbi:MAG: 16S rRNA (cytosine(967)-C(5))-methyltransferase RsmB [Deltaproteobacteria bacterium]|nr:16S rRNA (cytosine(967)-C(5))-methyltransferase RsmB [Deltaproteobacteria bacterium]